MTASGSQNALLVVIPAFNEQDSIRAVVTEVAQHVPHAQVLVVDDASTDSTSQVAGRAGAMVAHLPVNLGIGGAVQTGFLYAYRHSIQVCVQVDGDGQHDPREISRLLVPILDGTADLVVGSRWLGRGDYISTLGRRVGMLVLATLVRWKTGWRVTDPTSGFRATGRAGIELFARAYPTDFPEVEALLIARGAGLKVIEVPVAMRPREHGRSSIAGALSAYYMLRVAVAVVLRPVKRG